MIKSNKGFTLIEMLIVLAIITILYTNVFPRSAKVMNYSKEQVLLWNLKTMRECIDHYYGDHHKYPSSLSELVEKRYLREIPIDPVTDNSSSWKTISSNESAYDVFDVHSSSDKKDINGKPYNEY